MSEQEARARKTVLILACILVVMNMFYKSMPAVLSVDFIRDFHLSATGLSAMSGAAMLGFGLMQMPSGILTDFLGGRNSLTALFLIAGVSALLFSLASSAPLAIGLRFATGAGVAVTVPCLALLAQWFSGASHARANGIFLAMGALGPLVASAPLAYGATAFGWRPIILGSAIFSLIVTVLIWKLIPNRPPESCCLEKQAISLGAVIDNIRTVSKRKAFWLLAVCIACGPGAGLAFSALWWGPYLIQGSGFSQVQAGNILTAIFLAGAFAMPLYGWVYAHKLRNRGKLLMIAFALALLPIFGLYWASGKHSAALHIVLGIGFQFTLSGILIIMYTSISELFPLRMVGTALGCLNTILPIASMLVQYIVALVLERGLAMHPEDAASGFRFCMLVFVACAVLGFLAAFCLNRDNGRGESSPH